MTQICSAQTQLPQTLQGLTPTEQYRAIFSSNSPETLVQSLPLTAFARISHGVGADPLLIQLATAEQIRFTLDLELWEEWSISVEGMGLWLEAFLEAGKDKAVGILSQLDPELLLIYLKNCISVGGGLSDIIGSEDFSGEWDHTFDEIFYISIIDEEQRELVLRMLDLLYSEQHSLYRSLMLGVESDLLTELEELAWQFRSGRLGDEGLVENSTAASLFDREN